MIRQSKNDSREYKYVVLPNGLKCLLIYDKDTKKSGGSLTVGAGSTENPKDVEILFITSAKVLLIFWSICYS